MYICESKIFSHNFIRRERRKQRQWVQRERRPSGVAQAQGDPQEAETGREQLIQNPEPNTQIENHDSKQVDPN